jgi:hypothetical protein
MKIKYKITGDFGTKSENTIVSAHLLNLDEDSGVGLCYHPMNKEECGSFEFVIKDENHDYYISALPNKIGEKFHDLSYSNVGKLDRGFSKFIRSKK